MKKSFFNGSHCRAKNVSPEKSGQVENAIIVVSCGGLPFQGSAFDMAEAVLSRISKDFFPVILESWGERDYRGLYTSKVIFQAVRCLF